MQGSDARALVRDRVLLSVLQPQAPLLDVEGFLWGGIDEGTSDGHTCGGEEKHAGVRGQDSARRSALRHPLFLYWDLLSCGG